MWTATSAWTPHKSVVDVVFAETIPVVTIASAHVVTDWTKPVVHVLMLMSAVDVAVAQEAARTFPDLSDACVDVDTDPTCTDADAKTSMNV